MKRRTRADWRHDLKVGFAISGAVMGISAVYATLNYVLGGAAAFERKTGGITFPGALGLYAFGTLSCGFTIAILRPLRNSGAGSFIIGWFGALPLLLVTESILLPRDEWYPPGLIIVLIVTTVLGGGLAAALHGETKGWTK